MSLVKEQLMGLGMLCLEKRIRGNPTMVGQVRAPQDVLALIPGICEYVPLHGKRDFAGVIKLRCD